ncbi:hypothetical protein VMCG_09001 [Cytospora schulzeri]|uniref:Uncharacterized protein n=1 Tax=Cytospora schulzeri TaxID=448051 RepID=A0A423VPP6_9PEZI|nr:hypothetical protein VMCG_09001 [Valsa malicola]
MATHPQGASPATSLTIRDSDLDHALSTLRTTPVAELCAIRTLHIILTESNLLHWHGSLWPGSHVVFDEDDLDEFARLYPAPASSSTAISPPSEAFRALLRFVAESFDLGELDLEVNAGDAAWSLFEDMAAGAYGGGRDEVDQNWRFVYKFYLDVGRALAEVFEGRELRVLGVKTSIWDGMEKPAVTAQVKLNMRFPQGDEKGVPQDDEWCELVEGDTITRMRLAQAMASLLREQLPLVLHDKSDGEDKAKLRVLDLGAVNGMFREEIRSAVCGHGDGLTRRINDHRGLRHPFPEAKASSDRDRPGMYNAYVVADITEYINAPLSDPTEATLFLQGFNVLASISALAFGI